MNKKKVSVLIPSRGNPKDLAQAIRALIDHSSDPDRIEIIVRLDADDAYLPEYLSVLNPGVSAWTKFVIGQSLGYSGFNEYFEDCRRLACGDLIWVFNDDTLVETKDWDIIYETALSKIPFGVAAANISGDGYQWCMPMVRREVFDAVGHFCPFPGVTNDRVLDSYARQSGRGTVAAVRLHHALKPLAPGSGREKVYTYARSHWDEMVEIWDAAAKQILEKTNEVWRLPDQLARARAEAAALRQAVESAVSWQGKWHKRVFHRWQPPGQQTKRPGTFLRLENSFRKRRNKFASWLFMHGHRRLASWIWRNRKPSFATSIVVPRTVRAKDIPKVLKSVAFPVVANPKISIIIPTHGKLAITLTCLRSIAANMPSVPIEVLVLEDCSNDAEIDRLAAVTGLRYIRHPENLGFVRSNNRAADLAKGEYLYFLNNDTQVTRGWLDAMLDVFHTKSDCGLVGSKFVFPDGILQEAGGIVWKNATGKIIGRGEDPSDPEFNYLREVDYCAGASLLIRRDFFDELGRFDERYVPAYFEDVDLAFKVRAAGRKLYYQPKSTIIHYEGVSHGADGTDVKNALLVVNRAKFLDKWGEILERKHSRPA
jgi:GT2 family glycosyltransferase